MVYVGETSRSLKERAKEHEADVRLRREKPISEHFNGAGHRVQDMGGLPIKFLLHGGATVIWGIVMLDQWTARRCTFSIFVYFVMCEDFIRKKHIQPVV
ncbi:hypothetical protein DPMN_106405 [Dreissena polymorpha]|uniref:GIY-YIG domain-containing protein n=1 Tax=Dreissena polymorpha TaxID=45954 RepID=A0A9D4K548_DREPO|nr:hypothetical protein DPMN_106405 [Dreissena polymorpha]